MLTDLLNNLEQFPDELISSVVIVDNGSTDASAAFLDVASNSRLSVEIVKNHANKGFAFACNQGAALARSDILLFLNPDTRLFENSISEPMALLANDENVRVGIVGVRLIDDSGETARSCARFPRPSMFFLEALGLTRIKPFQRMSVQMSDWTHDSVADVDHVIGAFYMIRRSLFEQLGGFDERFFVYLEDLDLSLRAHQAGWRSVYLASASAYHAGGGTSRQVKARRLFYSLRSKLMYGFKHFSAHSAWALVFVVFMIEPFTRIALAASRGSIGDIGHIAHAYWLLFSDLPTLLRRAYR